MSNEYVENSIYNFKDFWVLPFLNSITAMSENENCKLTYREIIDLLFENGNLNEQIYIDFNKNNCRVIPCLYAIPFKVEADELEKDENRCPFEASQARLGLCCFCPLAVQNIFPENCLCGYLDEIEKYSEMLKQDNISTIKFLKIQRLRYDLLQLIKKLPYSQHYLNNSKPTQGF